MSPMATAFVAQASRLHLINSRRDACATDGSILPFFAFSCNKALPCLQDFGAIVSIRGWYLWIYRHSADFIPVRAEEMAESRLSKTRSVEGFVEKQNSYLRDHPKASASKMLEKVKTKLKSMRIDTWVQVKEECRILKIEGDEEALKEEKFIDGC